MILEATNVEDMTGSSACDAAIAAAVSKEAIDNECTKGDSVKVQRSSGSE